VRGTNSTGLKMPCDHHKNRSYTRRSILANYKPYIAEFIFEDKQQANGKQIYRSSLSSMKWVILTLVHVLPGRRCVHVCLFSFSVSQTF